MLSETPLDYYFKRCDCLFGKVICFNVSSFMQQLSLAGFRLEKKLCDLRNLGTTDFPLFVYNLTLLLDLKKYIEE